jgi:hypothetical protein
MGVFSPKSPAVNVASLDEDKAGYSYQVRLRGLPSSNPAHCENKERVRSQRPLAIANQSPKGDFILLARDFSRWALLAYKLPPILVAAPGRTVATDEAGLNPPHTVITRGYEDVAAQVGVA